VFVDYGRLGEMPGYNFNGQLGDGTNGDRLLPTDVSGLPSGGVSAIASGRDSTCALLVTGGVKCWGSNDAGNLGDGGTVSQNVPVDVTGLSAGVTNIAMGSSGGCAILTGGALKCWEARGGGRATTLRRTPVDVSGLSSGVVAVVIGGNARCVIIAGGALKCWGTNSSGSVGDGTTLPPLGAHRCERAAEWSHGSDC